MEKLLENFNLREEIEELVDCYFNPPFGWSAYNLGILKYNGKLSSFCCYHGQGIPEPLYNGTAEYVIELYDEILNYFDVSPFFEDYTKQQVEENIDSIYENVIDILEEYEKE